MNSRERVLAAVNHKPHDRIPVDIGANYATGFTVSAYAGLRRALGMEPAPIRVIDPLQMLAEVEVPVMQALDTDVIGLHLGGGPLHGWQDWAMPDGTRVRMPRNLELRRQPDSSWEQYDAGTLAAVMPVNGFYFDPVAYPQWPVLDPDALTAEVLRDIGTRARWCRENTGPRDVLNTVYS